MSEHQCNRCGETKAAGDMIRRGGKPAALCRKCFGASFRKGGKKKPRRATAPKAELEAALADTGLEQGPALSIAPGLGLQAWIENGCLQLAQGDDVVALSQTEAKVLFAQFDEWARA